LPISRAAGPKSEPDAQRRAPQTDATTTADRSLEDVRLLLVDDEVDTLELFAQILADTGAEIITAASAAEAMVQFEQRRPDVLICDIEMPGEDGYTLMRRLRDLAAEDGGAVPALAVTAYGRAEDRQRLIAAGYDRYLAKPIEPVELVSVIATLAKRSSPEGGKP